MSWIYLFIAGIFEIVWAVALKYTDGFSNWFYSAVTIIGMVASVYFLAVAMRTIPLGTAYAIWTGIGCIGALIAGILLFGEAFTVSRTVFAADRHRNHRFEILSFLIQELHNSKRLFELYKGFLLKSGLNT